MLDSTIKSQLAEYLKLLDNDLEIIVSVGDDEKSKEMQEFLNDVASLTPKITLKAGVLSRTPSFKINQKNKEFGVEFAGIPTGHEFNSLVLALLQVGGRTPKLEPEIIKQIQSIEGKLHFTSYISLTCQNCPDVVQALNMMSVLNPNISHTMVDGAVFTEEAEEKDVFAVPTVFLNDKFFSSGRISIEEILEKLGKDTTVDVTEPFDVLIIGGGPAGASAAIYSARKGVKTGVVAERIGGQVLDTQGIENLISVGKTDGSSLANTLENNMKYNGVTIIKGTKVDKVTKADDLFELTLTNNTIVKTKTIIVATGADWRKLGVPGEEEFRNKGVAYCQHCDGPLFAGKPVAVVGGGNSGIEAAIDLAGTSSHVTVLEFMENLKADEVLQNTLKNLPNVTVYTNVQVKEIKGENKVNSLVYVDRATNEEKQVNIDGVFVQIGLTPQTQFLEGFVERNRFGEIVIDNYGKTNVPGVFAAGDCATTPYKQIIVSMGSGAIAALSAYNYLTKE